MKMRNKFESFTPLMHKLEYELIEKEINELEKEFKATGGWLKK